MVLGRVLQAMGAETELRLVTAAGGGKDNAIPMNHPPRWWRLTRPPPGRRRSKWPRP